MSKKKTPIEVLIVNTHSLANTGDLTILLGQIRWLRSHFPGCRLTVTSRTHRLDSPLLSAWGVNVIAPIFHAPSGFWGSRRHWGKVIGSLLFPANAGRFLLTLLRSDIVVSSGGGYMYSYRRVPGLTIWQNYLQVRIPLFFGKKVISFPQSYGPFPGILPKRLLRNLIFHPDMGPVLVRERNSLRFLIDLADRGASTDHVRFCPDMAFHFLPAAQLPPEPAVLALPRPRIALAFRDWSFPQAGDAGARSEMRNRYLDGVVGACRLLHQSHLASFVLLCQTRGPTAAEDDRGIAREVVTRLQLFLPPDRHVFLNQPTVLVPDQIADVLREADILITSRLHASILSLLVGTPAVIVGYQPKCPGVFAELGLEELHIPIESLSAAAVVSRIEAILRDRSAWVERIEKGVSRMREMLEKTCSEAVAGFIPVPGGGKADPQRSE